MSLTQLALIQKNRLLRTKTVLFHGRKLVLVLAYWSSVPATGGIPFS